MMSSGDWQYALVWTPDPAFSTVQVVAQKADGTRVTYDSWNTEAFAGLPTPAELFDQLYRASLEAMERCGIVG